MKINVQHGKQIEVKHTEDTSTGLLPVIIHKTCKLCKVDYTWDNFWYQFNGNEYNNGKGMTPRLTCDECTNWLERWTTDWKGSDFVVIKGEHYIIGNRVDGIVVNGEETLTAVYYKVRELKKGTGFGGDPKIIRKDTGEIIVTTDLWHQGTVPETFKKFPMFKNNAQFVSV